MKLTVKGLQTLKGMGYINLVVPVPLSEEEEINKIDPEKQYVVEVKQWRKGRSNDANKYAWVLCQKIAELLGECQNIKGYSNVRIYYGSSAYDTKEMSRFIDCLVSMAKDIGVETRPQEELDELIKEWGVKDDSKNKEDKT